VPNDQNNNYQYNQTPNYGGYDTAYTYDEGSYQYFNGFEIIIIAFSILVLLGSLIYGFLAAGPGNRDLQRVFDINQVTLALDSFYLNSSTIPSERYYPISSCDGAINTVDYELTLREYLTGRKVEKETRIYINPNDWRNDQWGTYSKTLGERKIPLKCKDLLQLTSGDKAQDIYPDGRSSCNYLSTQINKDYYQCYLYGSSVNGDKYSIGYYSEEKNQMIITTKRRADKPTTVTCVPQKC
jgi:hypothetical protein